MIDFRIYALIVALLSLAAGLAIGWRLSQHRAARELARVRGFVPEAGLLRRAIFSIDALLDNANDDDFEEGTQVQDILVALAARIEGEGSGGSGEEKPPPLPSSIPPPSIPSVWDQTPTWREDA